MAERAVALAQQMDVLESAVKANNLALANQALGSVSYHLSPIFFVIIILFDSTQVTSGLRQQAQLARAAAASIQVLH